MMTLIPALLFGSVLVAVSAFAQELADSRSLLQQGLFAEEAEQQLDKAVARYERILANYAAERDYAVVALYRLAEVRRKQARKDEAAKLYQRILTEFPDANPQARLSRENLAAMGIAVAAPGEPAIPNDPDEDKELRRLMMLAENSPDRVWENVSPRLPKNMSGPDISPLANAAQQGWTRVATWLLDHREGSGEHPLERDVPLYRAAQRGHLQLCKLLVARGAEIEGARGALVDTIQEGFDSVANWLVENGVDINNHGSGYLEAIDGSTQEWPDWETGGTKQAPRRVRGSLTPLTAAIASDNKAWVDRLLELKADVNLPKSDDGNQTIGALAVACWKGHAPLVRRLLEAGADVHAKDSLHDFSVAPIRSLPTHGLGWTPLHYGAHDPQIIADLLKAGADPKAADSTGVTPLHVAAHAGNAECVRLLAEAGADPNAEAKIAATPNQIAAEPRTPLLVALDRPEPEIAQPVIAALLEKGAKNPFDAAASAGAFPQNAYGHVPANGIYLSEEFLIPELAAKPSISLVFPEAMRAFELATAKDAGDSPPTFAAALLSWKNQEPIHKPLDYGFDWSRPTLWRRLKDGSFSKTPVEILKEEGYPELQWGDVIAISSGQLDRTTVGPNRLGDASRPYFDTAIPNEIIFALRGASPFEIKLRTAQWPDATLTVDGGMAVQTPPWTTVPMDPCGIVGWISGASSAEMKSMKIRRGTETIELERADHYSAFAPFQLEAGDEITNVELWPEEYNTRTVTITLIEPEHQMVVQSVHVQNDTGEWTLFQLLATAYTSAALPVTGEKPTELELRSMARESFSGYHRVVTHPDFSSVRIRRLVGEDEDEEIIEVPITDFIAACGPDTPPADCRAKDIALKRGDIVELRPLADRLNEPWTGFDEATARFFEKALTYDIRVRPAQGEEIAATVRWKAPEVVPTKAGPVALLADPTALRSATRGDALRLLLPGSLSGACVNPGGALVDGMVIEENPPPPSPSTAPSLPRRRVVLPSP